MIKQGYHIVAPVAAPLREKAQSMIQRVQAETPANQHLNLMLEVISDLTETGLDFYFVLPLRRINASSMTMKVAQMGLGSTHKGMKMVIRKVLQRMDDQQLIGISNFLQEILFEPETQHA